MHSATIAATLVRSPGLLRCRLDATVSSAGYPASSGPHPVTVARLERGQEAWPTTVRKLTATYKRRQHEGLARGNSAGAT
jgi:hypothetical protein